MSVTCSYLDRMWQHASGIWTPATITAWQPMNFGRIYTTSSGAHIFLPVTRSPCNFLPRKSIEYVSSTQYCFIWCTMKCPDNLKFLQPPLWLTARELTVSGTKTENASVFILHNHKLLQRTTSVCVFLFSCSILCMDQAWTNVFKIMRVKFQLWRWGSSGDLLYNIVPKVLSTIL